VCIILAKKSGQPLIFYQFFLAILTTESDEGKVLQLAGFSVRNGMRQKILATKETFGGELYRLRVLKALTQADVAAGANVGRAYYSQIENSKRFPPARKTLDRILKALGLNAVQAQHLHRMAEQERSGMVKLPRDLPSGIENIIKQLLSSANYIPADTISKINTALSEIRPM
jgi:transcriptional regulator with XRE-family HTH domain